jgi:hypothetical protein
MSFKKFINKDADQYAHNKKVKEWNNLHDELSKHYSDENWNLEPKDNKKLESHSMDSAHINEALVRKYHDEHSYEDLHTHLLHADILSNILNKAPPLHRDLDVYSGISGYSLHGSNKGDKIHIPAFTSSSTDKSIARAFAERDDSKNNFEMLHFKLPKGSNHGGYIASRSSFPSEREFLINKGKNWKYHSSREELIGNQKFTIHELHPIKD